MQAILRHSAFRNLSVLIGGGILLLLMAISLLAPLISDIDPQQIAPRFRIKPPSDEFLMGTDKLGRDVWTRVLHGGQIS